MIDKHSGRGAVWIRQHFSVFDHHRLARISLRHRHAKTLEALPDLSEHDFVEQKPFAERARSDLACDVVFGWAKTAGGDHHFRATHGVSDCFFETRVIVAYDGLEFDFDTEAIELFGKPETICISAIGRK